MPSRDKYFWIKKVMNSYFIYNGCLDVIVMKNAINEIRVKTDIFNERMFNKKKKIL
jgi:hypothetical protein